MNIELYINKQLADIGDPNKFSIQLKKVLINPAELSTTNAQRSYNISLPATAVNNAILGARNTEEVRGKFAILFNAVLVVNGIRLLDGKFRLNEITPQAYSGNLGVPAAKTTREIFGNTNLSDIGEWELKFGNFKESVEEINAETKPKCIFPYVLYGLMPKSEKTNSGYSDKDLYDETVVITPDDLPPSINCLEAIKQMFKVKKLSITGTAFDDARLNQLYMSYSNPPEYEMPWNYGLLGNIDINVKWRNYLDTDTTNIKKPDYSMYINSSTHYRNEDSVYVANLLSSPGSKVTVTNNSTCVIESDYTIDGYPTYKNYSIIIPRTGVYKVALTEVKAKRKYSGDLDQGPISTVNGIDLRVLASDQTMCKKMFEDRHFEIKVVRDKKEKGFNFSNMDIDRRYYQDNMKQTADFNKEISTDQGKTYTSKNYPKSYPKPGDTAFIDPKVNPYLLCGLSFGGSRFINENNYCNYYLKNSTNEDYSNVIAIKGGYSWDTEIDDFVVAATQCNGYKKFVLDIPQGQNVTPESIKTRWEEDINYKVDVEGLGKNETYLKRWIDDNNDTECGGSVHQLIWLEKGERITLVVCAEATQWYSHWGMHFMDVEANLSITPYKTDKSWLEDQLDANGKSLQPIVYNPAESDFVKYHINLMKFLPSNKKADDWLTNFCKAFNLNLYYSDEDNQYHLDIKQQQTRLLSSIIDLDNRTNVSVDRTNTSMGIPKEYKLGFTVNPDEEGYVSTDKLKGSTLSEEDKNKVPAEERYDTGGGIYKTKSIETKTIEQTSNFSYCWYKDIKVGDNTYKIPIISDKEVWKEGTRDYAKMMEKDYINKPQRFWYRDGTLTLSGLGGRKEDKDENKINVATVTNELTDNMILDYKDKPNSIMNNYFALFTNADNAFTTVESYLTPAEYAALDYSYIKLNGDLYLPAEIDAFDPSGRKPCQLKLIRKLV